jgi:hypothetical protein
VELIAKLGDDAAGDELLFALTRAGVGHAAMLRDPARATPVVQLSSTDAGPDGPEHEDPSALLVDPEARRDAVAAGSLVEGGGQERAPGGLERAPGEEQLAPGGLELAPGGLELAPGDLELALRYLADATVIVLADQTPGLVPVAVDAAAFAGAGLVIVGAAGDLPGADAVPGATVFAAPVADPGGAFAALVAEYAVELDAGRDPAAAWAAATRRLGAEPA